MLDVFKSGLDGEGTGSMEIEVKEVVAGISSSVLRKYRRIDLSKIPDHVNYSKVEKYLRSVDIDITRKMFITYLNEELLPGGHEIKNSNYSYYTRDQIIYYMLVDIFKPILPLSKVKTLLDGIIGPMIRVIGLDATYTTLCEMIVYMVGRFEETVALAINEESRFKDLCVNTPGETDGKKGEAPYDIAHFTNLMTLCMAKGALDFYKHSPDALLE
jgi:hypothetical protein